MLKSGCIKVVPAEEWLQGPHHWGNPRVTKDQQDATGSMGGAYLLLDLSPPTAATLLYFFPSLYLTIKSNPYYWLWHMLSFAPYFGQRHLSVTKSQHQLSPLSKSQHSPAWKTNQGTKKAPSNGTGLLPTPQENTLGRGSLAFQIPI